MRKLALLAVSLLVLGLAAACSDDGGSTEAFCDQARDFEEADPNESPEEALEQLQEIEDDAPEEIRDDIQTLRESFEQLTTIDTSDPDALAGLEEDFADVEEAGTNIEEFLADECGIEPGG